jgi:hypothetical protein
VNCCEGGLRRTSRCGGDRSSPRTHEPLASAKDLLECRYEPGPPTLRAYNPDPGRPSTRPTPVRCKTIAAPPCAPR